MPHYLHNHTLQGDLRRACAGAYRYRLTLALSLLSVALFLWARPAAVAWRQSIGVWPHAVGGEAALPFIPWVLWSVSGTVRGVWRGFCS